MSFDRFLGFGTDACAVLDRRGTIAAVNDVWDARARAAGAAESAGIGVDYVDVCRRAASAGAPQAQVALDTLADLLAGRTGASTFLYPCTTPQGLAWFRADLVAVGSADHVGIRHVDVTAHHLPAADPHAGRLIDATTVLLTETGLRWALADALDGPPHPAVVVMVTDTSSHRGPDAAAVLGAAIAETGVAVDAVARLDAHTPGAVVTAVDTAAAVTAADAVIHALAERTGLEVSRWALANAVASDTAESLLARARRSLLRLTTHPERLVDHVDRAEQADRTARLHAAAVALTDAVADFDRALERGVDMAQLRFLDRLVEHAERQCVTAASVCGAAP